MRKLICKVRVLFSNIQLLFCSKCFVVQIVSQFFLHRAAMLALQALCFPEMTYYVFSGTLNPTHCKRCTSYGNSVRPSVRLSITRQYCVKTTARSTVQFALSDSKMCLVLQKPKKYSPGTTPSP